MSSLPLLPSQATKLILKDLQSRRMRDVIEKRFGLKGGSGKTLDAIGREYKITRERVRQIEADALKHISSSTVLAVAEPLVGAMIRHLNDYGGVMAEQYFLSTLTHEREYAHIRLVLDIHPAFESIPESAQYHRRWAIAVAAVKKTEEIIDRTVQELAQTQKPVTDGDLRNMLTRHAKEVTGRVPSEEVIEAWRSASKQIQSNPYGEFGLAGWSSITPSGVKDKAYAALAKRGAPLHFREVTDAINKAGWSKKKAHPQTVHNELIKDFRFVLVGRGLYALREWGYQAGTVRDVLTAVFKNAGRPLTKDEMIELVLKKRMVKVPTILLNVHDKTRFKKTNEGRYTLV